MLKRNREYDFWYAVNNTSVVLPPRRALETFDVTRLNYKLIAELTDDPHKVRIREGRLEAHRPAIITPEAYAKDNLEGFGEEARKYFDFLKANADKIRILQYGFQMKQEAFSEQIVTDRIENVTERVKKETEESGDLFTAVIRGVDEPWDVCLMQFFWLHATASAPVNIRELEKGKHSVEDEIESGFARAKADASYIPQLGALLKKYGVFEKYEDRFFALMR